MFKNTLNFNLTKDENILEFVKKFYDEYEAREIGFYHLPKNMKTSIKNGEKLRKKFKHIKDIIILGIGGSSLGTKALYNMIGSEKTSIKMHFLENMDAKSTNEVIKKIDKKTSLFFIISKSGTTLETISLAKVMIDKLNFKPKDFAKKFIVLTDPKSPLEDFAREYNIKYFNIPKNVGGRFSLFSVSSIIPLLFCGFDVKSLLKGARKCEKDFIENENLEIFKKAYHYVLQNKANINVVFSYGDAFREFNAWYIQLWGESLGKKKGNLRVGLTPIGLIGSTDQHSFLQLIMEGPKDKTVTFIKQTKNQKAIDIPKIALKNLPNIETNIDMHSLLNLQCDATLKSVLNENISTDLIEIDTLDEFHCGYLMYYYEILTSICGIMLDVNTYNQPGVEVGKKILKDWLK